MMSNNLKVKVNEEHRADTNGIAVRVIAPLEPVRDIAAAASDRRDIVRRRYTLYRSDKIDEFLARNSSAVAMLADAIPQIDAMTVAANDAPIQLMLVSDQETEPSLYARVIIDGSVGEAIALVDKLDDMQWSNTAKAASSLVMFDAGIA